jgi:hypothetical protein
MSLFVMFSHNTLIIKLDHVGNYYSFEIKYFFVKSSIGLDVFAQNSEID